MAFRDPFKEDLVKELNRVSLAPIEVSQAIFSPSFPEEDPRYARLRFTFKKDAIYRGSEILTYRRLDLTKLDDLLFRLPTIHPSQDTLHGIIPDIRDYLGIHLNPDEFEDTPVTESNRVFSVELKPAANSPRWFNTYTLRFESLPDISRVTQTADLIW